MLLPLVLLLSLQMRRQRSRRRLPHPFQPSLWSPQLLPLSLQLQALN